MTRKLRGDMPQTPAPIRYRVTMADRVGDWRVTDQDGRDAQVRRAEIVADVLSGSAVLRLTIPLAFVDLSAPLRRNETDAADPATKADVPGRRVRRRPGTDRRPVRS